MLWCFFLMTVTMKEYVRRRKSKNVFFLLFSFIFNRVTIEHARARSRGRGRGRYSDRFSSRRPRSDRRYV